MVGYWNSRAVENGILKDLSNNNNHARLTNATVGQDGIVLNGVSYITIPVPEEMKVFTDATMEFMVKLNFLEEGYWSILVADEFQDQSYLYRLGDDLLHVHAGVFDTSNSDKFDYPEYNINLGPLYDEYHVVYRYNNLTQEVNTFITNMTSGSTSSKTFTAVSPSLLVEGDILNMGLDMDRKPFHGSLNTIKMYNRYLTNEEIEQNRLVYVKAGL